MSCEMDLNMDHLVETIWKNLNLLRVYTKKRGEYPDFEGGLIIRAGSTVEHVVRIAFQARSLIACFRVVCLLGLYSWLFPSLMPFCELLLYVVSCHSQIVGCRIQVRACLGSFCEAQPPACGSLSLSGQR